MIYFLMVIAVFAFCWFMVIWISISVDYEDDIKEWVDRKILLWRVRNNGKKGEDMSRRKTVAIEAYDFEDFMAQAEKYNEYYKRIGLQYSSDTHSGTIELVPKKEDNEEDNVNDYFDA